MIYTLSKKTPCAYVMEVVDALHLYTMDSTIISLCKLIYPGIVNRIVH